MPQLETRIAVVIALFVGAHLDANAAPPGLLCVKPGGGEGCDATIGAMLAVAGGR